MSRTKYLKSFLCIHTTWYLKYSVLRTQGRAHTRMHVCTYIYLRQSTQQKKRHSHTVILSKTLLEKTVSWFWKKMNVQQFPVQFAAQGGVFLTCHEWSTLSLMSTCMMSEWVGVSLLPEAVKTRKCVRCKMTREAVVKEIVLFFSLSLSRTFILFRSLALSRRVSLWHFLSRTLSFFKVLGRRRRGQYFSQLWGLPSALLRSMICYVQSLILTRKFFMYSSRPVEGKRDWWVD